MIFSNSRNYNTNKRSRVSINVTYLVGVSSDNRHFFHIKQKITEIKFRFDIRFCKNYLIFSFFKKSFNDTKFQKKNTKKIHCQLKASTSILITSFLFFLLYFTPPILNSSHLKQNSKKIINKIMKQMLTSSNSHKRSQTYTFLSCLCENRIKKLKKTTFFSIEQKKIQTHCPLLFTLKENTLVSEKRPSIRKY